MTRLWHALDPGRVLEVQQVDSGVGLDATEVVRRQAEHGPNALPQTPPAPWWRALVRQFASPLVLLLIVAAGLAVALGHLGDAGVILAVVVANALIGVAQEGRAERSMDALRRLAELRARVRRDGAEQDLPARDLVPGDILLLSAGDAVGADARLLEVAQLQVSEAALTGESVPVAKAVAALPEATGLGDRHCMVHAGTHVAAGRAVAVVVATGVHSEVGQIAGLTARAKEPPTPLEHRIGQFGRWLVAAALVLFTLVMALGLWRGLPLAEVLMVAISQMVSMVPEGLPVAMTVALAVGMQRMAARGAIIRRLSAVETLGSTTVICSDKTGTLTRNQMTAVALWLPAGGNGGGREIRVDGIGYSATGALHGVPADDPELHALLRAAALCNDAELLPPDDAQNDALAEEHACEHANGTDGQTAWRVLGDPTEGALRVLAAKAGLDLAAAAAAAPREAELPFDADAKLMATRHRLSDAARRVWIKGAPEAVLRLTRARDGAAISRVAREQADAMARRALRVLAFAEVDDDPLDAEAGFDALAGRARLLGLVGQIDPPRDEVRDAVAQCHAAGMRVVMVTGDHKLTGLAIAQQLGIARDADTALEGAELERMGEAELREALPQVAVFARVQPAQKLRIVEALQAGGEVVAMTGDGVNDAPALARADVGVAMGVTGTEVAKSASKIVITNDDFGAIVAAVTQGRVVYANLKKVILYLFATSLDEVAILLLAMLGGYPLPLAAVQILWINIVTEGTLTVNLAMEPADGREMRRPPVRPEERLLDRAMLWRVALMATVSTLVCFGWFVARWNAGADLEALRTEVFTLLAMCQWFNVLSCRSATRSALGLGLLRNRWLLGGLLLSIALQALVLYAPFMNDLFHTVPLAPAGLLPLLALASAVLWAEEARKLLARRRRAGG